jgi:hypothetical protein
MIANKYACYTSRMKQMFGYTLAVLVLIAFAVLVFIRVPLSPKFLQSPGPNSAVEVTVVQVHEDTSIYSVNVEYPQFGIPVADAAIKSAVESAISDFEKLPANPPDMASSQNELDGIFDSAYIGSDFVSTKLTLSQYTGGAHPNAAVVGINIDRATGKELTLSDMLSMTGMTLQQVSAGAKEQLQKQLGADFIFPDGSDPTSDNYSTFIVGTSTVSFIFQEYQVAPYSDGVQTVSFPRK